MWSLRLFCTVRHIFFTGRLNRIVGTDVQRQHMCADVLLRQSFTLDGFVRFQLVQYDAGKRKFICPR